ncbi:hypothetical protein HW115_19065 [Verrucomicrobiaceae bacterium N1E253]|uniref:DUF6869 domain-containing protein n=1 Tax=Oceaniferula marina TaxID=2748318 RepID=A0A851GRS5_9BACT|nr:hypothetical protein [Oceaniferula marina]NWK57727.1 hypothetical protein [Oceaniferula marina]
MKEPPFPTRDDIITGWIDLCHSEEGSDEYEESFWSCMLLDNLIDNFPLDSYKVILDILARDNSYCVVSATGMSLLVHLIGSHGEEVIDRLEHDVRHNSDLHNALEGIYNQGASDEVWRRVKKLVYTIN